MQYEKRGLTNQEAVRLLEKYGPNVIPAKPRTSDLKIFVDQLKSPLIYILIFAATVTILLKDFTDTVVIMIAVIINTILGFYQERKAERALDSLKAYLRPTTTVFREGKREEISIEELVPGDIIILASGEKIPADGRVVEAYNLTVNEAILTGESAPVIKHESNNKIYMGTTVVGGRGLMVVEKTGQETEIGKIATSLREEVEEKTPLQKKIAQLASFLAIMVAVIAVGLFLIGILVGRDALEMFTVGVAVAVAAIPEGLVVALTAILAIGMQRILKRHALVRKLLAVETLGSVTLVCSDKTGTLTEGRMSVQKTDFINRKEAIHAAYFANAQEDPLEIALNEWVSSITNIDDQIKGFKKIWERPFDPEEKYQIAIVEQGDRVRKVYISGAPEVLLKLCEITKEEREKWEKKIDQWADAGLRIIGFAFSEGQNIDLEILNKTRSNLKFTKTNWLGIVGIEDPVRGNVVETIERMHKAGIGLKIITGDYLATARAVWHKIKAKSPVLAKAYQDEQYVLGADLSYLGKTTIFARVTPRQKLTIVKAFQDRGEIVALFGDGVNDALALKRANIGIVVNEAADTAKEIADIVLLDSNFKTVIAAIEEGRSIYDNFKKVMLYLLSDSFAEIILIILALFLGSFLQIPLPLTAAQILWINLLTDGFPNLALTVEPKERGILSRRPEDPHGSLLAKEIKILIGAVSVVTGIISFIIFLWFLKTTGNLELARTVTFAALGVSSLLYVFSVRSLTKPLYKISFLSNPYLLIAVALGFVLQLVSIYVPFFNTFLETVPLGLSAWIVIFSAAAIVIVLIEGIKYSFSIKK